MKLLLTSGGLRNQELRDVFGHLLPRPAKQCRVAIIPTASKNEADQQYVVKDIADLKLTGVEQIDVVDISELERAEWLPMLQQADVIFVVGGDVYFLRDWVVKSGLSEDLPDLLREKVYVGISAGSKLMGPECGVASLYFDPSKDGRGLGLVDFNIVPHMNSDHFADRTPELVKPKLADVRHTTYLIDDDTAILVDGSLMQFVGGGEYVEFPA